MKTIFTILEILVIVLFFIPDTQLLYLVDAHGGDFHLHSTWPVSALLPENETTDLVALIGTGEDHDHDHEGEDDETVE
mgnify:CR=1 FL=1